MTLAATLAAAALAGAAAGQTGGAPPEPLLADSDNPSLARAAELRCPDLVMKRPHAVAVDRRTRRGRVLLRSTNSIDNVGEGPASLRGRRDGRRTMGARQAITRSDGRVVFESTGARLYFQPIPGQDRYWKFADAARFELWSLDSANRRVRLVRTGPKQNYCLRDLERTNPSRRSPRARVFPACSQSPRIRAVTLGTSVGWSDIYPATYHQNWIDVTGVPAGRYAYVHIADPKNGIWENDETNNESYAIVRLPSGRATGGGGTRTGPEPAYP